MNVVGGVANDTEFNRIAGINTLNATWLEIDFTPDLISNISVGDIGRITMNVAFGSEEYNAFVYGGVNDVMAIIVNGENKAIVPNGLEYGIDTMNDAATYNPFNGDIANDPNPTLYKNNTDNRFNTQMNGFTVTIPVTFDIVMGQSNKMKIGIADASDFRNDSWLFVKENSGQTVIVAENDALTTPTNAPYNIDVLANDYDRQGDPLTIIRIDDQPINTGETIVRPSGVSIKLETDGTLTVKGDGTNLTIHDLVEGSGFDPLIVDTDNDGVLDAIHSDADRDGIADSVDKNIFRFGGLYKRVTVFLIEHGVKGKSIISFTGRGEREPRVTNQSQAGRAKNRRVELLPQ